jgi:hypothetical protein
MKENFVLSLIREKDPTSVIFSEMIELAESKLRLIDLDKSYEDIEDELLKLEKWLFDAWGVDLYRYHLANREKNKLAISKAFKLASEKGANVLISDGYSLREHVVVKNSIKAEVDEDFGLSATPSITSEVSKIFFNVPDLKQAFSGRRFIEGSSWEMYIVDKIKNPPRTGKKKGIAFLTYYPDAPLHEARKHGIVELQSITAVVSDLVSLIDELSSNVPLVVTGDHGYIFTKGNPGLFLWKNWESKNRYGESYGEFQLKIDGTTVAIGRKHAPRTTESMITHGGVSLAESLVPITIIHKKG